MNTLEEEARKLRDEAYGQVPTDANWSACSEKWMTQIDWLRNITKPKASLLIGFAILLLALGCRNNPSTSAFPSIGQMLLMPFHHEKEIPQSYWFTGVPDDSWTPLAKQMWKRDGTNFLGVYMGMIAERYDGIIWSATNRISHSVQMFSATSGELLRWIPFEDFKDVYVYKTKPEYPSGTPSKDWQADLQKAINNKTK